MNSTPANCETRRIEIVGWQQKMQSVYAQSSNEQVQRDDVAPRPESSSRSTPFTSFTSALDPVSLMLALQKEIQHPLQPR